MSIKFFKVSISIYKFDNYFFDVVKFYNKKLVFTFGGGCHFSPPFALLSYACAQLNRLHTNVAMVLLIWGEEDHWFLVFEKLKIKKSSNPNI